MSAMLRARYAALALLGASSLVTASVSAQATLITGLGGPLDFGIDAPARGDDGASVAAVDLTPTFPSGVDFYGQHFTDVWVNVNGSVSFGAPEPHYTETAFPRTSGPPMIAAFWANVDTTPVLAGEVDGNQVYYAATAAHFVATWIDVGYFDAHTDRLNAFQLILSPPASGPAGTFDVELRYHRCEWASGDASGGMGAMAAQAGLDAADGVNFLLLPGSGSDAVLALCDTSNVVPADPGVWDLGSVAPAPSCGNGSRETGEACDDGNTQDHDLCDNACHVGVPCFTQYPDGGVDDPFPDAMFPTDVGPCAMPDAGLDAGLDAASVDAAPPPDTGPARPDGGRRPDAGTRFDAGNGDANLTRDGGIGANRLDVSGGGCGCRAGGSRRASGAYALGALFIVLTRIRARARARAGTSRRP